MLNGEIFANASLPVVDWIIHGVSLALMACGFETASGGAYAFKREPGGKF